MEKTKKRSDFGGPIAVKLIAVFMVIVPIYVYLSVYETNKSASFSDYFSVSSVLFNLGLYGLLMAFSLIPFGGKRILGPKTENGQLEYYLNGPFCLFFLIASVFTLHELGWNVLDFITNNYLQLLVSSNVLAAVLAAFVYYRSFGLSRKYLNANAEGTVNFYDFFIGREINPRLFGVIDLYTLIIKICVTVTIVVEFAYVEKAYRTEDSKHLPTIIFFFLIQSIYLTDAVFFEERYLTSFEVMHEGLGLMTSLAYLTYPYFCSSSIIYIINQKRLMSSSQILVGLGFFAIGYIIFLYSNNVKGTFRKDPLGKRVRNIKTLSTKTGKKLMISGPWGMVRHPNYLGDFILHIAFIIFTGVNIASVPFFLSLIVLLTRSRRDGERCKIKYGEDWIKYCNIVKYQLIPGLM